MSIRWSIKYKYYPGIYIPRNNVDALGNKAYFRSIIAMWRYVALWYLSGVASRGAHFRRFAGYTVLFCLSGSSTALRYKAAHCSGETS